MTTTVEQLARRLSLGAVVVVGAGMSLQARYPDTLGLNALLWDALDANPAIRAELASRLGTSDAPTKELVGDDFSKRDEAWRAVTRSPAARHRFQQGFVALDGHRADRPSASHESLARLIHSGLVELVVSFNWDSALERAYERLYGVPPPAGSLRKPHGDTADPSAPWILPHEDGLVGEDIRARTAELAEEHPRILVVVGYSESDRAVVEHLIAPLDERWRVIRIGPTVNGAEDVAGNADDVLSALAASTAQREDGGAWTVVTFSNQHGVEAALEGRRMAPNDVTACPSLLEVDLIVDALLRSFAVVLNGESGSGKSLTAYQAAHKLQQHGYEVLRLRDRAKAASTREWLASLDTFPRPTVLFVDDAQDLDADAVRELAETASPERLVLIAGVDHVAGGVATFTITGTTAVGTLERYVLDHKDELLPKVRELDDWVGEGLGDEPFAERVRQAARETTAWQFFYTLTGGWRRIAHTLHEVRTIDRADLLACALAVAQIANVDSGVTIDDLVTYAATLGRDGAWVERNLKVLRDRRLAVEDDGVWRCAHLRTAYAVLSSMLHPPRRDTPLMTTVTVPPIESATGIQEPINAPTPQHRRTVDRPRVSKEIVKEDRKAAAALLSCAVNSPTTSLRGLAWLLGRSLSTESRWVIRHYGVRSSEIDRTLAERALATPTGVDVGMAAQLLEQLSGPDALVLTEAIWEHIEQVVAWVEYLTPPNGWAVGNLINVLHNDDAVRLASVLDGVDPTAIAALIDAGGWAHIYSSMTAVDRVAQGGGIDLSLAIGEALDEVTLDRMLEDVPDLQATGQLLGGLAHLNPDLGVRLFEKHAQRLAQMFSPNPLERFHDLFTTFGFLLQSFRMFRRTARPPAAARRAARTFLRAMDTAPLIAELAQPKDDVRWNHFYEFVVLFMDADPTGWAKVADTIDLNTLESELVEQLPNPGRNVLFMLHTLTRTHKAVILAMLDRHGFEFGAVNPYLVYIYPELAVGLVEAGLPLDLGLYDQRYESAAELLALVGGESPAIALEVAEANVEAFREGLIRNFQAPFTDLSRWVAAVDEWAPGLLDEALIALPAGVVAGWTDALRKRKSKKEIGPLVMRAAATGDTTAAVEAAQLLSRFTSLSN